MEMNILRCKFRFASSRGVGSYKESIFYRSHIRTTIIKVEVIVNLLQLSK